jgi:hypothetical protein
VTEIAARAIKCPASVTMIGVQILAASALTQARAELNRPQDSMGK